MMSAATAACSPSETKSTSIWQPGKHIPQLDGVRGLAILIVTLYRFSKELPTDNAVGRALHTVFTLGDRGVDLFFVLSGFLITGILVDAKGQSGYFRNFFARRSLRIFPLYFFALFLFLGISQWSASFGGTFDKAVENQFFLWTYLTNFKMSLEGAWCFGYLDHFWSLAVEEHFYFVWPFIIFFCSRSTALRLAIGLAAASALSRMVFAVVSNNGVAPDVLSIFRFDALLIGSALALQIRSPAGLRYLKLPSIAIFAFCLLAGVGLAVLDKRAFTLSHTLWPLIWACVAVWLLSSSERGWLAKSFNQPSLRKLGKYSYAMYVFQSPLIPITAGVISVSAFEGWTGNLLAANLVYIATMFALTFGAALLSWHLLEKHCLTLKDWFPTSGAEARKSPTVATSLDTVSKSLDHAPGVLL